jgi:hypothetical protein
VILTQRVLDGVRHGTITRAYRKWRRPTVKSGGTLLTAAGQLEIRAVAPAALDAVTDADAQAAGFPSREALVADLASRADGVVYRIDFGTLGADPRVALREQTTLDDATRQDLRARLLRLDARAEGGAWTRRTLEAIRDRPGLRAAELCRLVGQERLAFKANVRKLKALGLTESLEVGYRLAPRGAAVLAAWDRD